MAGTMARVLMASSAGLYPPLKGGNGTSRRRRRSAAAKPAKRRRRASSSARKAKLVKGSKAAKAWGRMMARKRRK